MQARWAGNHDSKPLKVARLEGFEPPTNGFGSRYSIRLSYRRVSDLRRSPGSDGRLV